MLVRCVWEHHGEDTLLYAADYPGAYTRGNGLKEALEKMPAEIQSYQCWLGQTPDEIIEIDIVQEKESELEVRDADSDVLFDRERLPLSREEYDRLKALALKSARDFLSLYQAVPDENTSCLPERNTFYGAVPRTAREMYEHTKSVNAYYFGEVDANADNEGSILECRERGFAQLESQKDFLLSQPLEGSYGEEWSVRKVIRRFIWHDRIHAKAMYRMAQKTFATANLPDPFCFD